MTDPNADLADIRTKWLAFCSHDLGLPYPCICPTEDHRPLIAALVTEVETLRAEVARSEADVSRTVEQMTAAVATADHHRQRALALETDLAALHAEAARLRTDLDLAERDKAHALVDQMMDVRDLLAVDQMAPSSPRSEPQSDERGEVADTDTVEPQSLTRPFWYREPENLVTLHVNSQGSGGLAFVAIPARDADAPYEQYGVVLPPGIARNLALRMLATLGPETSEVADV